MSERPVPSISVVMPAYNAEKYIQEAIFSILNQTFGDFELIIINDGSSDGTKDIILSFKDPRIIYIENQHNSGIVVTLNNGLSISRGKYIARMDADDISKPDRLATQFYFLEQNKDIIICGTDIELFGDRIDSSIFKTLNDPSLCSAGLLFTSCFAHPSVMWRSEIMKRYNLKYEDSCKGFEDYKLWWEFAKYGELSNINIPLVRYRLHPNQETKNVKPSVLNNLNNFHKLRLEEFNIIIEKEQLVAFENYNAFKLESFNHKNIENFINLLSKICKSKCKPIITTKKALKITSTKAIAYIIQQKHFNRKYRIKILTHSFNKGIIPLNWYLKYLMHFMI